MSSRAEHIWCVQGGEPYIQVVQHGKQVCGVCNAIQSQGQSSPWTILCSPCPEMYPEERLNLLSVSSCSESNRENLFPSCHLWKLSQFPCCSTGAGRTMNCGNGSIIDPLFVVMSVQIQACLSDASWNSSHRYVHPHEYSIYTLHSVLWKMLTNTPQEAFAICKHALCAQITIHVYRLSPVNKLKIHIRNTEWLHLLCNYHREAGRSSR